MVNDTEGYTFVGPDHSWHNERGARCDSRRLESRSYGYWKNPVVDPSGNMVGGEFIPFEQEARDTISDRLARIEEKLDRLLAAKE